MMARCGLSMAVSIRWVISFSPRLNRLWIDPMTKSRRRQRGVVVVERPVGQDVGLDSLQDPKAGKLRGDPVDLLALALQVAGLEPAGVRRRLAVVGDADPGVPRHLAGLGQLGHAHRAVGVGGVTVQEPAEVGPLDQRSGACLPRRPPPRRNPRAAPGRSGASPSAR